MEIGNFEDLVFFLKLKFEDKNWQIHAKQLPTSLGCTVGSGDCLVVFHKFFFHFQSLFKFPKILLKFMFTLALKSIMMQYCLLCLARYAPVSLIAKKIANDCHCQLRNITFSKNDSRNLSSANLSHLVFQEVAKILTVRMFSHRKLGVVCQSIAISVGKE